jgi:signal transduction histidine kinase
MLRRPTGQTPPTGTPTDGPGGRVLLIDDSPIVLEAVGELIASWGHEVTTAERADEGLSAIGATSFDAVIADISMPGMDGLELLAVMRAAGLETPVIMLSASSDSRTVMRAVHDGAFDYVNKDDGLEPLASAVKRAMAHTRLRRENLQLLEEQRQMNLLLEQKVRERTVQLEEVNQRLSAEHGELARAVEALRDAQGQLIQAEKMATVGLFTAGIAHEINNPLGFLLPDFEELERWVSVYRGGGDPSVVMSGADLDQLLRDCRDGLRRIAHIVKQISVFSHQTSQDTGRVELAAVAANALRLLDKEAQRHGARLVPDLETSPAVRANADQLQQVMFNLMLNAIQGLDPARGEGRIELHARAHGAEVVITVEDNGRGISARNLDRVFEPFFTTKRVGEGTGLGLSICRRLVQRMGGRLELVSREGQGTTAYLVLPAWEPGPVVEGLPDPLEAIRADAAHNPKRRLLVAVVDDEPALLPALRRLFAADHDVVTFADPVEAKEWLLYGPQPDVVLCDLMMPVLGGRELYLEVTRVHPMLASRFLFVTGAPQAREAEELRRQHHARVLPKPLDREALLAVCPELGRAGWKRRAA